CRNLRSAWFPSAGDNGDGYRLSQRSGKVSEGKMMKPLLFTLASTCGFAAQPFLESELIIPLENLHNHSSCVVELPNKDLYVCWYNGSGERTADDVKVEGARLRHGAKQWTNRITLADTPGFPDTNPAMFLDSQKKLWLLWPVILANEWHTALMKYRI